MWLCVVCLKICIALHFDVCVINLSYIVVFLSFLFVFIAIAISFIMVYLSTYVYAMGCTTISTVWLTLD